MRSRRWADIDAATRGVVQSVYVNAAAAGRCLGRAELAGSFQRARWRWRSFLGWGSSRVRLLYLARLLLACFLSGSLCGSKGAPLNLAMMIFGFWKKNIRLPRMDFLQRRRDFSPVAVFALRAVPLWRNGKSEWQVDCLCREKKIFWDARNVEKWHCIRRILQNCLLWPDEIPVLVVLLPTYTIFIRTNWHFALLYDVACVKDVCLLGYSNYSIWFTDSVVY